MKQRILIVCLGNICRSPMAQGVLQHELADRDIKVDSAGTGNWHSGDAPDARAIIAAGARGYDLRAQRARQLRDADFDEFDLILTMDRQNLADVLARRPETARASVAGFLDYAGLLPPHDVPDPWYTGDFDGVLRLIETAASGIAGRLQ